MIRWSSNVLSILINDLWSRKIKKGLKWLGQHWQFITLILSASFATWQYRYAPEREFKKVFYEKQIGVVTEVFDILAEIDAATTDEAKKANAAKFWGIYYGKGRAFLDAQMFEALQIPAEYIENCVTKERNPKHISCDNLSVSKNGLKFAIVARVQLSNVWDLSLSDIAEDPWLTPKR